MNSAHHNNATESRRGRRWATWVGAGLAIVALGFIFLLLWRDRQILAQWQPGTPDLIRLLMAVLIYAFANVFLALAWIRLLHNFVTPRTGVAILVRIYSSSQLGKYIPGNVAHLAGRHVLGRGHGYDHAPLVTSAMLELLLLLMAAAAIVVVGGLAVSERVPGSELLPAKEWLLVLFFGLPLAIHALFRWGWPILRRHRPGLPTIEISLARLWPALLGHLVFFLLAGGAFHLLLTSFDPPAGELPFARVAVFFAVTWLIGVVTPGAPSGVGVREAALVVLLQPVLGDAWAVLVAVQLRLVTVLGDVLFYLACLATVGRSGPDRNAKSG